MKKLLLTSAVALILFFCGADTSSAQTKHLDFNVETTTVNPSELLTTKYIKLETKDNSLISIVRRIKSTDKYIFILDGSQNRVLAFDHSGKYVGDVGRQGKGPKEYSSPSSFFIDDSQGHIVVVDRGGKKINRYSFENGFEFISSSSTLYSIGAMEVTPNGNIICKTSFRNRKDSISKKDFLVFDKDLKIKNAFVEVDYIPSFSINPSRTIYKTNGDIFGYNQYEPIIYKLTETAAIPFYTLSFGEKSVAPLSFYQDGGETGDTLTFIDDSEYICLYYPSETVNDFCITFDIKFFKGDKYIGFWDKKSDKTYSYERNYFAEQLGIGSLSNISRVFSDYFVTPLDIESVKEKMAEGAEINTELSKLIEESKEGDNPILFLFKTK